MARHARDTLLTNDVHDRRLDEHAANASALIAGRANARREQQEFSGSARREGGRGLDYADQTPIGAGQNLRADAQGMQAARQAYSHSLGGFVRQNIVYIGSVAVVVLLVAMGILVSRMVLDTGGEVAVDAEEAYVSPYDWSKLDRTGERFRYVVNGQVKSRLGVDVSDHQHEIDWNAVAADGIDFAVIRVGYRGATEGQLYLDEQFWANLDGARDAGLDCGVYFFSQAQTVEEAIEEADYVLTYLNGTPLEYPIAFDSEEKVLDLESSRTTGLSNDEMTAIAEAFCTRVEQAGYRSIIYGNARDLARYNYDKLEQHDIWWAQYEVSEPAANIDISMWQYSAGVEVAGIPTLVDMNIDLSAALS